MTTPFHHDPNTDIGLPIDPYPNHDVTALVAAQKEHEAGHAYTSECWVCVDSIDPYEDLNPPTKTVYRVLWDNDHSCDVFPQDYETELAAIDAGEDWLHEMVALDDDPEEAAEVYSYEVIEVQVPVPPPEGWEDETAHWREVMKR